MSFRYKNMLLLAKAESTYGTDPTPVEASNAMLTANLSVKPYEGSRVSRVLDKGALGNDPEINVGAFVQVEFDIEAAGTSDVVTAHEAGPLFDACGMEETITAITGPIEYEPESLGSGFDSATLYFNHDGEQQKIVGCRGTFSLRMNRGELPYFHFTFTGIYAKPTAVTQYSPTVSNFVAPQPVNQANTGTVDINSVGAIMSSFQFDQNNDVIYRNLPGMATAGVVEITDRDPRFTLVVEAPTLAVQDFYALVESHTTISQIPINIIHGSASTNQVEFDAVQAQLISIEPTEEDGIKMYSLSGVCPPTAAGNDDFKITVTGP